MNTLEAKRQTLHIIMGVFIALMWHSGVMRPIHMLGVIIVGGIASLVQSRRPLPGLTWILQQFDRPEDMKVFPGRGSMFLWIGAMLAALLYPRDVATAAILIVAFGDAVPHVLSRPVPKTIGQKDSKHGWLLLGTTIGTLAAFAAVAAMKLLSPGFAVSWTEAFIGSAIAMVIGAIEIEMNKQPLDDNLLVPLVAGGVMMLMRAYLW
ncbi:hypothetical protein COY28_00910 [Candidatus Woesearchaeota archaeon CG_4_10_14_0_2_um_filter_57_5]|nr:MAG: hypothetical protein AUJ68_01920 [Candidatus Woesearchaeota archaeon CG1_02_57_44]PIZ56497.1 MAG: hypothetical protein COY28_00910 [Candidatus Woesearchaeota archaeon CG_4_10_14_0_2_um_filter_57_5]